MADNYLERRMDDYRSGRLSSLNRSTPRMRRAPRPDAMTLVYPPMSVVVAGDAQPPLLECVVREFASVGCSVAFTASDVRVSAVIAQKCGARFYPSASVAPAAMVADVVSRRGVIDVAVLLPGVSREELRLPGDVRIIEMSRLHTAAAASHEAAARLLVFLSHPDNGSLIPDAGME